MLGRVNETNNIDRFIFFRYFIVQFCCLEQFLPYKCNKTVTT